MSLYTQSIHYTTYNIMFNVIYKIHNTINYLTHERLSFKIPLVIHEIPTLKHIH